jgi:hypothetical protein
MLSDSGHQARNIDYVAFGLPQGWEGELASGEDAHEIQVDQLTEVIYGKVIDRLMRRVPPGIVDQAINSSVERERSLNQILYIDGLSDIAVEEARSTLFLCSRDCLHRVRGGCALGFAIRADDYIGARLYKLLRARLPDSAAASGD